MSSFLDMLNSPQDGLVMSTSRRWIYFLQKEGDLKVGTAATNSLDVTVGDRVHVEKDKADFKITSVHDRENFLTRQYGNQVKRVAANLDRLYIITAPGTLLNTAFIDRIICAAFEQAIPCTLVVNKSDLGSDAESDLIFQAYSDMELTVIQTSAKSGAIDPLLDQLAHNQDEHIVSFAGVSGVGKSSLLNALIPEADRNIGEVSVKTGQGKQTTTQSRGYRFQHGQKQMLVIDLPGIQNFGITHLERQDILRGMPDILHFSADCEYYDCAHRAEEHCAVKDAVRDKKIAAFRYDSYLAMLDEIESAKQY